jgi:antitoxin component HigA of HigAB toxin-antitoxin module
MTANPTNKPRLPTDPTTITEVNLTIPIDTPKRITETARLLRPYYYFQKLPTEWIQIPETNKETIDETGANKEAKPQIPDTIEQIQEDLKNRKIDTTDITLPITSQDTATSILAKLRQHYTVKAIPEHILKLPPLPEPEWEIFCPYPN